MGHFEVEGQDLVLRLSSVEKVEGLHGDIRVPVTTVREVRAVTDPWSELRGIRSPGTGLPGVVAVGTRRWMGVKDFAAVHGKGPALVVDLDGTTFDRLVATDDRAEEHATELRRDLGLT